MSDTPDLSAKPCISFRKTQRAEAKKRKAEAFLDLVSNEPTSKTMSTSNQVRLGTATTKNLDEDANALLCLRENLRKSARRTAEPTFYLTECGVKAQVNLSLINNENPPKETIAPLFVEDIQYLLIRALLGDFTKCFTRWCKLMKTRCISRVLLLIIDGLSKDCIVANVLQLKNMISIFPNVVEVVTPDSYSLNFATELSTVHLTHGHRQDQKDGYLSLGICNAYRPLSTLFPITSIQNGGTCESSCVRKNYSKLHLLLSPIQLVMENYPLPRSVFVGSKSDGYCFTKAEYSQVNVDSPIYALDCEMCQMKMGRMEVTRIAIIDEKLDVVYSSLVKPDGEVSDYLTHYSGVTKEMLKSVKTRLRDVQEQIKLLLPSDAILCGQSLNCDLHALKMIHPYVIDTSIIYNISGTRTKKAGLKLLAQSFLNEVIQDDQNGHNPIEDCVATMKLVHLKLQSGPQFGDAILAGKDLWAFNGKKDKDTKDVPTEDLDSNGVSKMKKTSLDKSSNGEAISLNFFSKLQDAKRTVCIVGNKETHKSYSEELTAKVKKIEKSSIKKIIKHTAKAIKNFNLTISHISLQSQDLSSDSLSDIDSYLKQLYDTCDTKSLFVTFATGLGRKNEDDKFENGLCMVKVKEHKK